MTEKTLCPLCGYAGASGSFVRRGGGRLSCCRCRQEFADPGAGGARMMYADCDSTRPCTRFPFAVETERVCVKAGESYVAIVWASDGQSSTVMPGKSRIFNRSEALGIDYICLKPHVIWGCGNDSFGAHGTAVLNLSSKYALTRFAGESARFEQLEAELESLLREHMKAFIVRQCSLGNAALLTQAGGYSQAAGALCEGVTLERVIPYGYRDAQGRKGRIASAEFLSRAPERPSSPRVEIPSPLVRLALPADDYTVRENRELVVLIGSESLRHKTGEVLRAGQLTKAEALIEFARKDFTFPFGWGLSGLNSESFGTFSANGDIAFYIDNTAVFARLFSRFHSFGEFCDSLYTSALKSAMAQALQCSVRKYSTLKGFHPEKLKVYLSELSIDLMKRLNGEASDEYEPAFRRLGLRVKSLDIDAMRFESAREGR